MKKFLSIVLAGMMVFSLAACGGEATTAAEKQEPLVEQTLFDGITFQLPKSIVDTKKSANGQIQYFPDGKTPGTENIVFSILMADYSGESDVYFEKNNWNQTFAAMLNNFIQTLFQGSNGTLMEKGDRTLDTNPPIEAKYCKLESVAEDGEYNHEYVLVPDVNSKRIYIFSMVHYTDFDNIYADVWEDMLNSITLTEAPAPVAETPSASNESGIDPEFKEMMDSYEAFLQGI